MPKETEVIKDKQSQEDEAGQKSSKVIEDLLTKRLRKDTHQFNEMIRLLVEANKSRSADPFVKELREFYQGGGLISDEASTSFLQNLQNVKLEAIGNDEATGLLEEVVSRFDVFLNQQEKEISRTTLKDKNELREKLKEQRLELARHQQRMKQAVERNTRGEGEEKPVKSKSGDGEEKPVKSKSGEGFQKGFSGARDFITDKLEDKEKTHFAATVANAIVPGLGALVDNLGYDETKELVGKGFSAISKVVGAGKRALGKEIPSTPPPKEMPDPDPSIPHEEDDTEETKRRVRGKDKKPRKRRGQKPVEAIPDEIERQGNRQIESSDQVMTILKRNLKTTEQIREITSGIRSVVVSMPEESKELQKEDHAFDRKMYKKERGDEGRRDRKHSKNLIDTIEESGDGNDAASTILAMKAGAAGSALKGLVTTIAAAVGPVVMPLLVAAATTYVAAKVAAPIVDSIWEGKFGDGSEADRKTSAISLSPEISGLGELKEIKLPNRDEFQTMVESMGDQAAIGEVSHRISQLKQRGPILLSEIENLEAKSKELIDGLDDPGIHQYLASTLLPDSSVLMGSYKKAMEEREFSKADKIRLLMGNLDAQRDVRREKTNVRDASLYGDWFGKNLPQIVEGVERGGGSQVISDLSMPFETGKYGEDRGGGKTHKGNDFRASNEDRTEGTPLPAYFSGTVIEKGRNHKSGKFIRYVTDDGRMIGRAHMSEVHVGIGDKLSPTTTIGISGKTGDTNQIHDHMTYYPDANNRKHTMDAVPALQEAISSSNMVASTQGGQMLDRSVTLSEANTSQPTITPEQAERIAMGQDRVVEAVKENTEFHRKNAANQQTPAPIDPPSNMDEDGGISHVNMIHQ